MTDRISAEGETLNETLATAVQLLGAHSIDEIGYAFDKEHFRKGARTVKLEAWLKGEEDLAALRADRKGVDDAKAWMTEAMARFGAEVKVSARKGGDGRVYVQVLAMEDARLLIGRQGTNIRALQALLEEALKRAGNDNIELKLDVDSPEDERGGRDDRGGRDRGRDRDRGDRDRGDRDRGGRDRGGRDRGGRDRDRGARGGRDRGGRGGRDRDRDRERDQEIQAAARGAADKILDGDNDAIVLGDMNSYERHLAHATIKDIEGVDSRSVGSGGDRNVEVFLTE
jgi:predicted RNA-binding protein Jag